MNNFNDVPYPDAVDPNRVGQYPTQVNSGGGYFYDDILEYRVWVHPYGEEIYYQPFATYEEALQFSRSTPNAEKPLVLVSQEEYIDEPQPGKFTHVKKPRLTEWQPEWIEGVKGTKEKIPLFLNQHNH